MLRAALEEMCSDGVAIQKECLKRDIDDMEMVLMNMQCDSIRNKVITTLRLTCINIIDCN